MRKSVLLPASFRRTPFEGTTHIEAQDGQPIVVLREVRYSNGRLMTQFAAALRLSDDRYSVPVFDAVDAPDAALQATAMNCVKDVTITANFIENYGYPRPAVLEPHGGSESGNYEA